MRLRTKLIGLSIFALVVWLTFPAFGQETPIIEIPFESLPDGLLVQGQGGITLDGNVTVNQNLDVAGIVESDSGGFQFPDGSIQITAATVVAGASASVGLYDNRIVEMTPPQPFSEICFKNGQAFGDIHVSSESTAGGNCLPGDLGFILERNQRAAANWEDGRLECLLAGMRFPEPFEWLYSCNNAGTFGMNNMTGDWEWVSNSTFPVAGPAGFAVNIAGLSNCNSGSYGYLAASNHSAGNFAFRCLR